MNLSETAKFLATVSVIDNRRTDDAAVKVWNSIIGDIPAPVAMEALRRFRRDQPGVYLEPGYIVQIAKVVEREQETWRMKARALRIDERDMSVNGFITERMQAAIQRLWDQAHKPEAMVESGSGQKAVEA